MMCPAYADQRATYMFALGLCDLSCALRSAPKSSAPLLRSLYARPIASPPAQEASVLQAAVLGDVVACCAHFLDVAVDAAAIGNAAAASLGAGPDEEQQAQQALAGAASTLVAAWLQLRPPALRRPPCPPAPV